MASKKKSTSTTWVLPEIIDYVTTDKRVLAKIASKEKSAMKSSATSRQATKKRKR